jgi:hypothetical protein
MALLPTPEYPGEPGLTGGGGGGGDWCAASDSSEDSGDAHSQDSCLLRPRRVKPQRPLQRVVRLSSKLPHW